MQKWSFESLAARLALLHVAWWELSEESVLQGCR